MVSVLTLTAREKVPGPTVTTPGVWPQPEVFAALQMAALITETWLELVPPGTYRLWVAGLSTGGPGPTPTLMTGGTAAQPEVLAALQVEVLITDTVLEKGSDAYRVWVASSMLLTPMLAAGSAIGILATGAHPDTSWAL